MLGSKKNNYEVANTLLGSEVTINGTMFTGSGTIRIDGQYLGEMNIDGTIIIGEKGLVEGNIKTKRILIAGTVTGDIFSDVETRLSQTAHVNGNITTTALIVDEGAEFNGTCKMIGGQQAVKGKSQAEAKEMKKVISIIDDEQKPPKIKKID